MGKPTTDQAESVTLSNQETGKPVTPEPRPNNLPDTIPCPMGGRKKKEEKKRIVVQI